MDVREAIRNRRSVRDYTNQPVDKATLMALLQAATFAPSAVNHQSWAFAVVQDKSLLKDYSDRAKVEFAKTADVNSMPPQIRTMLADPEFNIFHNAGTLIVICAKPIGEHPDWDCYLAGQNLMLAAHAMGLGSCPIGFAWPLLKQPDGCVKQPANPDGNVPTPTVPTPNAKNAPRPRHKESDAFFVKWFESHGHSNVIVDGDGVGVANNATRLRASLYGSKQHDRGGFLIEMEFTIRLPSNRSIPSLWRGWATRKHRRSRMRRSTSCSRRFTRASCRMRRWMPLSSDAMTESSPVPPTWPATCSMWATSRSIARAWVWRTETRSSTMARSCSRSDTTELRSGRTRLDRTGSKVCATGAAAGSGLRTARV